MPSVPNRTERGSVIKVSRGLRVLRWGDEPGRPQRPVSPAHPFRHLSASAYVGDYHWPPGAHGLQHGQRLPFAATGEHHRVQPGVARLARQLAGEGQPPVQAQLIGQATALAVIGRILISGADHGELGLRQPPGQQVCCLDKGFYILDGHYPPH
jgi:hypothetical protein